MVQPLSITRDGSLLRFPCPHCGGSVEVAVTEVNCGIFRHGVVRATSLPIPPHATRSECDALIQANAVWGCGRPIQLAADLQSVRVCDYI
jgi:hypothetical protein